MSIINCPSCGLTISSNEPKCPACGNSATAIHHPIVKPSLTKTLEPKLVTVAPQDLVQQETAPCPFCGEPILRIAQKCKHCGEFLNRTAQTVGVQKVVGMIGVAGEVKTNVKQGALLGAVVCFALGVAFMLYSIWAFLFYGVLFLAALVLSVVAMAQRRVLGGVVMLLATIIVPITIAAVVMAKGAERALGPSRGPEPSSSQAVPFLDNRARTPAQNTNKVNDAEMKKYIEESLILYEVEAKYHESILAGKVPGILFKLRNNGNRQLNEVDVLVSFMDAKNRIIHEETFYPVLKESFSSNNSRPLKPGFIWQMETGHFYSAKSVPSEWEEGAIIARVIKVEFSESE